MKPERINLQIPLPSTALKDFLKKVLTDDSLFASALENPVGVMKQHGINLNASELIPTDLATFFGALTGLRQVIKDKKLNEITFEKVFGQVAVVRGAVLDAQVSRGFFREWDNRDAFTERGICVSTQQKFEVLRERGGSSFKDALAEIVVEFKQGFDTQRDLVSRTFESQETNNHTKTDWSNPNDMQSNKGSDRGVDKNFEKSGNRSLADLLSGPLIHPTDLAAISARIEGLSHVLSGME